MPPKAAEQYKEEFRKVEDKPPKVGSNDWIPVWILFGSIILVLIAMLLWSHVRMIVLCLGVLALASGCVYALYRIYIWMFFGDISRVIFDWMYDNSDPCLWWLGFFAVIATLIIAYPFFFP